MGRKHTLPFPYYGGKYNHLDWLLPQLPEDGPYVEPFGGSAVVLINREPTRVETYNDILGDVVNFFDVLRDQREELLEKLKRTPYSREMYRRSTELYHGETDYSRVDRALYFLINLAQGRDGIMSGSELNWAYDRTNSRRGRAATVSAWEYRQDQLEKTAERLSRVQIEHHDYSEILDRYDYEDALFYCDPPYPPEVRNGFDQYKFEMSNEDHRDLADHLDSVEGRVALSGYNCDLMEELYGSDDDWYRVDGPVRKLACHGTKRQEVLWTNYDPATVEGAESVQTTVA